MVLAEQYIVRARFDHNGTNALLEVNYTEALNIACVETAAETLGSVIEVLQKFADIPEYAMLIKSLEGSKAVFTKAMLDFKAANQFS